MSDTNKGMSKPVLVILGVSLALNLFLGGLWIGAKMAGGQKVSNHPPLEFNMRKLRYAIQGDKAIEFRRVLREQMGEVRGQMEAQREVYKELGKALAAEDVDIERVRQLLEAQRAHSGEFRRPMHEALLAVLPQMTKEERLKLVEALSQHGPRYRKKRDGNGEGERRTKRRMGDQPTPPPAEDF